MALRPLGSNIMNKTRVSDDGGVPDIKAYISSHSLGGPFPSTSHRCHHKPKHCLPIQCGGGLAGAMVTSPLLFHPSAKGSQIVMDPGQRMVKRQASFCNAITFTNRPVSMYEQVRLKPSFYCDEDTTRSVGSS
ncbi:unnamed protein product [Arctogadus glacialis]